MAAAQTFQALSKEVVEHFLQTVVVLDDGGFMEPETEVATVQEPDKDAPILEDELEGTDPFLTPQERTVNSLNSKLLITNFAVHGMVCAVLSPPQDGDGSAGTICASRRADIVILDWELGDEGEKALHIIGQLIKNDMKSGGRLRMIVVYTANPKLADIRTKVSIAVPGFEATDRPGNVLALASTPSRILFIRKGNTSDLSGQISESDLPGRLIEEFVDIGTGILANVALGCIAAIREETHRVLARFHSKLDAPFLTHRILLERPKDAEAYAVDLLSSEFESVLHQKEIGTVYADHMAFELAIAEREERDVEFRLMTVKDSEDKTRKITADDLMKLVRLGPVGLKEIANMPSGKKQQERLYEHIYLLFSHDLQTGKALHYEFARTSAHTRERALVGSDHRAKLDFGSIIVGEDDEYLVCIQPSCDALRLGGSTQFIFASLSKDRSVFDVVVRDLEDQEICLKLNSKASMIRTFTFDPDETTGTVLSSTDNGERTFTSTSRVKFTWMCDLRTSFAQRFVHRIASTLSRIGLEEFEWQRLHSPG